jgi:hypothetical protein
MTDIEISKVLALAIGHEAAHVNVLGEVDPQVWVQVDPRFGWTIRVFDYRDWKVIGPIAERYNTFPIKDAFGRWFSDIGTQGKNVSADTPQKAIALAVIGAKK